MATKEKYVALMNPRAKKEVMTWTTAVVAFCLLYTSDAADEEDSVDLGGRRIIKKNKNFTRVRSRIKF